MALAERPRLSWLAALMSFFVPGLGQAYLGRWMLSVLLVAPFVVVVATIGAVWLVGMDALRSQVFSTPFLLGVFVLNAALLAWRVFAIAHAGLAGRERARPIGSGRRDWRSPASLGVVVLLVLASIAMHAYVAMVVMQLNATLGDVFTEPEGPRGASVSDPDDDDGDPPADGSARDDWDGRERINFLLLGVDEAPGRHTSLTDTILVLSIDPADESAVMISIPRDTGFVPLPSSSLFSAGLYPYKINQLAAEATANPSVWCPEMVIDTADDATSCGIATLEATVSLYLGIPIHYYARVDIQGFERVIDAVGGIDLCLPGRLVDPAYHDTVTGQRGLELPAGCNRYDGASALAYARSRQGWIELPDGTRQQQNDFLRADRQQEILLALRDELDDANLIFELPPLLEAFGSLVRTDFPRSRAGDLATLVPLVTGPDIERVVLGHPEFVDLPLNPETNYVLTPKRDSIREGMEELLKPGGSLDGWYLGSTRDAPSP